MTNIYRLTNLLEPTSAQHAATKNYVDTQALNKIATVDPAGLQICSLPQHRVWSSPATVLAGIKWYDRSNPANWSSFGMDNIGRMKVSETNGIVCAFIDGNNTPNTLSQSGLSSLCDAEQKDSIRNKTDMYVKNSEIPVKDYWNKIVEQMNVYTYVYKDKEGNPQENIYQSTMWQEAMNLFSNIGHIPQKLNEEQNVKEAKLNYESYYDGSTLEKSRLMNHQSLISIILSLLFKSLINLSINLYKMKQLCSRKKRQYCKTRQLCCDKRMQY